MVAVGRSEDSPTAAMRRSGALRRVLLVSAVLAAALLAAPAAHTATYTVTTTADSGAGSLRQAILDSNGSIGIPDTIDFNIAGAGPHVIQPVSALPQVTDSVTIDGRSELSAGSWPLVTIDGGPAAPPSLHGLDVQPTSFGSVQIQALAFIRWDAANGMALRLASAGTATVFGSLFGLDANGVPGGNHTGIGIENSSANIGGTAAGTRNVISGNVTGVSISALSTTTFVGGNWIGVGLDGVSALGNSSEGVLAQSFNGHLIGGPVPLTTNRIRHNGTGIRVTGGSTQIRSWNEIDENLGLGIDLGSLGVTANDPGDADTGPNALQNYPTGLDPRDLGGGQIRVAGTLDSVSGPSYTLRFYASPAADASGHGEGARFLGETTSSAGSFSYTFVPSSPVTVGDVVSATATDPAGNTSEFSAAVAVTAAGGATFVVNTAADTISGVCDVTHCSLREAILAANANAGADTIGFAISTGPQTIAPATPLPTITGPVRILGSTQPGFDGRPIIELNGAGAGASAVGLDVTAGSSTVEGLVINRFGSHGIQLRTNGSNTITGNYVGTDLTGTVALANGTGGGNRAGVFVDGVASNTIGGSSVGAGNVISGHSTGAGVEFFSSGATGNVVQGNRIGTNAAGTAALPNGVGVSVEIGSNTIGGAAAGAGNLISGNTRGIDLDGESVSGVLVRGNRIGTDAAGTGALGNGTGVLVDSFASGNTIGGTGAGEGNTIAYNSTLGIDLQRGGGNRLLGNLIHTNGGLGIDLSPAGVTANDAGDGDVGTNELQNFPEITAAVGGGAVTGTLASAPSTTYRLEFFANASCDPSGNGEGARFVGATDVSTSAGGSASFSANFPLIAVGEFVTATATDPSGNTSEFSACVLVRDFTVYVVASSGDSATCETGACSLRWAINAANSDPGLETIRFSIGDGPVTISPTSMLPVITGPVILDATTQPGYSGVPLIRLDGTDAGPNNAAFDITAGGSTVRGFSITNFSWDAVKLRDGDGNTVEDNYLGLFPSGDGALEAGNGTYGVLADFNSNANVIRRNVIGGNGFGGETPPYAGIGIFHDSAGNTVEQNSVGVFGGSGGEAFPNALGVIVSDSSGTNLNGNTIAHSAGTGVSVFGISIANRITENLIHTNGGLGINLGFDGVTANDTFDADTGPNELQNFPVITGVEGGAITGTIHSKALFEYRLEFFSSAACDPSGNGEGARFLGGANGVGTGQTGTGEFTVSLPSIAAGEYVTATATDPDGSTSEFSSCFLVPGAATVTADVTIAPQAGSETVTAPARVELADVPAETFIAAARSALEASPLGSIPLGSIPLGSIPLGSIPLGSIGLLEPEIRALLGGIALSTVPLTPPHSWESLLQGTTVAGVPLQSLSLQQALDALAGRPGGIASVPLGSIGLRNSVLGSLTPEAVGLGVAPLGSIQIGEKDADETGDTNLDDWCEWLSGPPVNCTNSLSLGGQSVLSTSLRGVPLGSIPLGSIPLGSIPLGSIPLGSIPLGSIDIEFSPLGSIPLGSIDLLQSPLGSIPLGSIPLGSISTVFTCSPACPATGVIRDHLGQLKPGLTLEQFLTAVGANALGNLTFKDVLPWVAPATLRPADTCRPARRVPGRGLARLGAAQPRGGKRQPARGSRSRRDGPLRSRSGRRPRHACRRGPGQLDRRRGHAPRRVRLHARLVGSRRRPDRRSDDRRPDPDLDASADREPAIPLDVRRPPGHHARAGAGDGLGRPGERAGGSGADAGHDLGR